MTNFHMSLITFTFTHKSARAHNIHGTIHTYDAIHVVCVCTSMFVRGQLVFSILCIHRGSTIIGEVSLVD